MASRGCLTSRTSVLGLARTSSASTVYSAPDGEVALIHRDGIHIEVPGPPRGPGRQIGPILYPRVAPRPSQGDVGPGSPPLRANPSSASASSEPPRGSATTPRVVWRVQHGAERGWKRRTARRQHGGARRGRDGAPSEHILDAVYRDIAEELQGDMQVAGALPPELLAESAAQLSWMATRDRRVSSRQDRLKSRITCMKLHLIRIGELCHTRPSWGDHPPTADWTR